MRILVLITVGICLLTNFGFSQTWIFEYDAEKNTFPLFGRMLEDGKGSYHNINVAKVPTSGKDIRGRLIHLDDDGSVVSFFRPQDCEVHNYYFPFGSDAVITIGPNCTGQGPFEFTLFDVEGKRTWNQIINEDYYYNYIIQYEDEISFIQQSWDTKADNFLITTIDKNLKLTPHKIPLDQIKSPGHRQVMYHALQSDKEAYLLAVQIYDVDQNSVITDLYSKLVFVNHGIMQWVKNLEHTINEISYVGEVEKGIIITGIGTDSEPLVMLFDFNGNELKRFTPECFRGGFNANFYCTGKSLMVVDQKIKGTDMFFSSYDPDGNLEWKKTIPTTYARFGNAEIVGSDETGFLVQGSFAKEYAGPSHAFVMKFLFKDMITDTFVNTPVVKKVFSEDIIANVDQTVSFVRVYPNPTQFELTFEIENSEEHTEYVLILFDLNGKEVLQRRNRGSRFSENISHLSPAIYIYNIHTSDGKQIISGQIVKQ